MFCLTWTDSWCLTIQIIGFLKQPITVEILEYDEEKSSKKISNKTLLPFINSPKIIQVIFEKCFTCSLFLLTTISHLLLPSLYMTHTNEICGMLFKPLLCLIKHQSDQIKKKKKKKCWCHPISNSCKRTPITYGHFLTLLLFKWNIVNIPKKKKNNIQIKPHYVGQCLNNENQRKQEGFLPCQTPAWAGSMSNSNLSYSWWWIFNTVSRHKQCWAMPVAFFTAELWLVLSLAIGAGLGLILAIRNPYLPNECQIIIFWMLTHKWTRYTWKLSFWKSFLLIRLIKKTNAYVNY